MFYKKKNWKFKILRRLHYESFISEINEIEINILLCLYIYKKKRKNLNIIQQYKLLRNEIIVQFVLCEVNVKFDWYIFVTDNFTFL